MSDFDKRIPKKVRERAADVMKRLAAGERLANVPGRYLNATLRRLYVVNMPMQYRLVLEHTPKGFQPYMEGLMSHELFNKRTSRTQAAG